MQANVKIMLRFFGANNFIFGAVGCQQMLYHIVFATFLWYEPAASDNKLQIAKFCAITYLHKFKNHNYYLENIYNHI